MANPFFKFKNFTVWHDKCAMKVGTDGVLLGAWASVDGCDSILDVGTGTGLISLMVAQRCEADIHAIDIDEAACLQAKDNIAASAYRSRIQVTCTSVQEFAEKKDRTFSHILSNPPYFPNSLKGPDKQRNAARHNDTLPLEELLASCNKMLAPEGKISLILPESLSDALNEITTSYPLYPTRRTLVIPTPGSVPKRILLELSRSQEAACETSQLIIELARHQYSADYIQLTKEYYLNM
ncbi:tRNA1(Val) (adenine(37)-N6)-methyltransferase [Macellibacteroides fermentans]|uniref:tRNA1(Val) (adenine(37)-N6)-methyltransferase n=1 Tax=Parabacteroides chartae TaxID=1037355 RepID=A0A1T5B696_9BACT|nr:methyltransferase [Parabacteroides chartae]SKB42792.1 tRNA1Val (adenine37-N6)-methyltransferase [Parabacteroides chartae]